MSLASVLNKEIELLGPVGNVEWCYDYAGRGQDDYDSAQAADIEPEMLSSLVRAQDKADRRRSSHVIDDMAPSEADQTSIDHHMVHLSNVYQKGAILLGAVAIISLALWAFLALPIVSPFFAVLMLAFAPFVYLMGKSIE